MKKSDVGEYIIETKEVGHRVRLLHEFWVPLGKHSWTTKVINVEAKIIGYTDSIDNLVSGRTKKYFPMLALFDPMNYDLIILTYHDYKGVAVEEKFVVPSSSKMSLLDFLASEMGYNLE